MSLLFGVSDFALIRLTTNITHLDLRGFCVGVKSLPQLMLYMRNFKTLKLTLCAPVFLQWRDLHSQHVCDGDLPLGSLHVRGLDSENHEPFTQIA